MKNRTPEEHIKFLEGAVGYLSLLLGAVIDSKHLADADTKFNDIKSGAHGVSIYVNDDAKHGAYWARDVAVRVMEERK